MLVKVCKHGNSLSVRLGAYITQTTRIKRGDWVDVVLLSNTEILIKTKALSPDLVRAEQEQQTEKVVAVIEDRW